MKRLILLASWLYPSAWRTRYGAEFEALIEDVKPRGRDVWDVVRGAFVMQMTMWNFGKVTAICGLAGVIVAGVLAYVTPAEYVSIAVMRISPAHLPGGTSNVEAQMMVQQQRLQQMQQKILSRSSLAEIITRPTLDLYKNDRSKLPLEDIVQDMRNRRIRIRPVGSGGKSGDPTQAFEIAYTYPNKFKAQAVVRELVTKFVEQNVTQQIQSKGAGANLEVLDPASLPDQPASPNWPKMLIWGLVGGLVVGLVTALVLTKPAWRTMQIIGFGVAGFVVVASLSFLIPNQYVSNAVLRAGPGALPIEQLFDPELLSRVAAGKGEVRSVEELRRRLTIRRVEVAAPVPVGAFVISFQSTNRFVAQAVVREVIAQAFEKQRLAANGGKPWVPGTTVPPAALPLQVLDPASDPARPSSPNRLTIALIGLLAGLILGAWFMRTKRTVATA